MPAVSRTSVRSFSQEEPHAVTVLKHPRRDAAGTQVFDANGVALVDVNTSGTRKAYDAATAQLDILAERQAALEVVRPRR